MLRVAVVGTGWWGKELAKAAVAPPGVVELAGCYSLSEKECAEFRAAFGGKIYGGYDDILADPGIGAVILATPHSTHCEQIVQAASAGKNVFCEKPLTLTVETAHRAIKACRDAGVVLAVGHNRRYLASVKRLKALIDGGECGRVLHVEANYSGNGGLRYPPGHWRSQRSEMPSGGIAPMALHAVDTFTWILGPVVRLMSIAKRQVVPVDIDDTSVTVFELESGITGTLGSLMAVPTCSYVRIYGTRAILDARANFSELTIMPVEPARPQVRELYSVDDSLQQELRLLAEACAGGAPYPLRPEEALRNVAVLEAIRISAEAGGSWTQVAC
jgi:predicted dehydrogenase